MSFWVMSMKRISWLHIYHLINSELCYFIQVYLFFVRSHAVEYSFSHFLHSSFLLAITPKKSIRKIFKLQEWWLTWSISNEFRWWHYRKHKRILPRRPPIIRPRKRRHHYPSRSNAHSGRCLRQSRRFACTLGLPIMPRPAKLRAASWASRETRRSQEMGLPRTVVRRGWGKGET